MSLVDGTPQPLSLTRSPRLDNALRFGWEPFARTLRAAGPEHAATWLANRLNDADLTEIVEQFLVAAIGDDIDESGDALFALAELAEEAEDDLLADTLWEGVLERGHTSDNGDLVAEASRRLAALAERNGDPLAAAEYLIDFLNWRRESSHVSDPEDVEIAFDEIVRLAESDGAPRAAAEFAYRQVQFTAFLDSDDPRTVEGNWEPHQQPYVSWA